MVSSLFLLKGEFSKGVGIRAPVAAFRRAHLITTIPAYSSNDAWTYLDGSVCLSALPVDASAVNVSRSPVGVLVEPGFGGP